MRPALWPLLAAILGVGGSIAATEALHAAGVDALDRVLDERLRGTGATAAVWFRNDVPTDDQLRDLARSNALDGAYVLDADLRVLADSSGKSGQRVDLLRVDPDRVASALRGETSVGYTYSVGEARLSAGYFPIVAASAATRVLALEAGPAFAGDARVRLDRARAFGLSLALLAGLGLVAVALAWSRSERLRREAADRAARVDLLGRMAATVAHEIRNPLGVIRGTVELMRRRAGPALGERDAGALDDILGEVDRLRRLTDDFMDLTADKPLNLAPVDLAPLVRDTVAVVAAAFPGLVVDCSEDPAPPALADRARVQQVLTNLFTNAIEADPDGALHTHCRSDGAWIVVRVRDEGPGIPESLRSRLFEPFATEGKAQGTGLGLAISRRLAERQGGTLAWVPTDGPGTTFELRLPAAKEA